MSNDFSLSQSSEILRQKIHHQVKTSIDSLYSSAILESFSVTTNSKKDSMDSEELAKVVQKTNEMKELISARLTAFLYMSKQCLESGSFEMNPSDLIDLKSSLSETLNACIEQEDKTTEIFIKSVIEKINQLEKEFRFLNSKLVETQSQVRSAEDEEMELKTQMHKVEGTINRFIIETREESSVLCNCTVF